MLIPAWNSAFRRRGSAYVSVPKLFLYDCFCSPDALRLFIRLCKDRFSRCIIKTELIRFTGVFQDQLCLSCMDHRCYSFRHNVLIHFFVPDRLALRISTVILSVPPLRLPAGSVNFSAGSSAQLKISHRISIIHFSEVCTEGKRRTAVHDDSDYRLTKMVRTFYDFIVLKFKRLYFRSNDTGKTIRYIDSIFRHGIAPVRPEANGFICDQYSVVIYKEQLPFKRKVCNFVY